MLKVENLNQYYGGSHILRGLSFELELGKVTTLLGRSEAVVIIGSRLAGTKRIAAASTRAQVVARLAGLRRCSGASQRGQRRAWPPAAGGRASWLQMWQLRRPAWRAVRAGR